MLDRRAPSSAGQAGRHLGIQPWSIDRKPPRPTKRSISQTPRSLVVMLPASVWLSAYVITCQLTGQSSSVFIYNTVNVIGLPTWLQAHGNRHLIDTHRETDR